MEPLKINAIVAQSPPASLVTGGEQFIPRLVTAEEISKASTTLEPRSMSVPGQVAHSQFSEVVIQSDVHMVVHYDSNLASQAVIAVVNWVLGNVAQAPETGKLSECVFVPNSTAAQKKNMLADLRNPDLGFNFTNPVGMIQEQTTVQFHELAEIIAETWIPQECDPVFLEMFCACQKNSLANACYVCQAAAQNPPVYLEEKCCCAPEHRRLHVCKTCESAESTMRLYREIIQDIIDRTIFPFSILPFGYQGQVNVSVYGPQEILVRFG